MLGEYAIMFSSVFPSIRPELLVDLREIFFRPRGEGGGGGDEKKKSSENDQLTGHFQSFFFSFS